MRENYNDVATGYNRICWLVALVKAQHLAAPCGLPPLALRDELADPWLNRRTLFNPWNSAQAKSLRERKVTDPEGRRSRQNGGMFTPLHARSEAPGNRADFPTSARFSGAQRTVC